MDKPLPELNARNFPTAQQDAKAVQPPSLYGGPKSAFSLAFTDTDFLLREELRPVRMQLELLKPELLQREQGIESTIVIYGSARIPSFEAATEKLALAREAGNPQAVRAAETALAMSHFYEEARRFSALVTERSRHLPTPIYVVTGGGPGIMEAGNRGASDVPGGRSVGLGISLPFEEKVNAYVPDDLAFEFHYFFMRKYWFAYLAKAMVIFPGGFGTFDELCEILTLRQTGKIKKPLPMVLFGRNYWDEVINMDAMVRWGTISESDLQLVHRSDSVDDAFQYLTRLLEANEREEAR